MRRQEEILDSLLVRLNEERNPAMVAEIAEKIGETRNNLALEPLIRKYDFNDPLGGAPRSNGGNRTYDRSGT